MKRPLSDQNYHKTLSTSAATWTRRGRQQALSLFHSMAKRVPAYQDFLQKHSIDPDSISTIADFSKLPFITKENYLESYPLEQQYWDGNINHIHQYSSSSGSTGQPFYWGVGESFEYNTRWHVDFMLRYNFDAFNQKTLIVNCYALGTWIAGTLMNDILWDFARQGRSITLTSPGINKVEAVRSIKKLASMYDQVILLGYGPFVKDIIEESMLEGGVDWRAIKLGLWTGGETYNESWRDYMADMLNIDRSRIVNKYASIDNGPMATETAISRGLRQAFAEEPRLGVKVYGQERQPSLVQYNPETHYVEEVDGELIFTRDHGIPLVRYNIGDSGGILSYSQARKLYQQTYGSVPNGNPQTPFLYVFGRSHHTNTIYGLNVYPENIRAGAEDPRVREYLSSKCITSTGYSDTMDQRLEVVLELAPGAEIPDASTTETIVGVFVERMSEQNTEYRELVRRVGEKAYPMLTFVPYGDPQFVPGAKQPKAKVKQ